MAPKDFQTLYAYNRWANVRIFDAAAKLTAEQYTRDLSNSFRSVRDTLTHILAAEWIWLKRWHGESPKALLDPADFPNLVALRAKWMEAEREQTAFVNSLTDERLNAPISYINTKGKTWTYPLWQMMQHLVNHSTYHRGQVTTMLRQFGAAPAATDFLLFFDENPDFAF